MYNDFLPERRLNMVSLVGSNLIKVKEINKSKILQTLFFYGPISRIDIARKTMLTPPTITSNITELIENGIIMEVVDQEEKFSVTQVSLGRKPILLDFVPDSLFTVGVDWGPSGVYFCVSGIKGDIIAKNHIKPFTNELDYMVKMTKEGIIDLLLKNNIKNEKIIGVGVGIPGFIEGDNGIVKYSPVFKWSDIKLTNILQNVLELDVAIENNVRLMAVAETYKPGAKQSGIFAYVYVSRGIAAAIIIDNRMLKGSLYGAGEIGHMTVEPNGPKCNCGKYGCLETISSESAILNKVKSVLKNNDDTILNEIVKDPENPKISEVLSAFSANDLAAVKIMRECVKYLGMSVANMINIINPKFVMFDGNIFKDKRICDELVENIWKHTYIIKDNEISFEFKPHIDEYCAIGAAAYAMNKFFYKK